MKHFPPPEPQLPRAEAELVTLSDIVAVLRRYFWAIAAIAILVMMLGIAVVFLMPKKYEASSMVLIDPRQGDVVPAATAMDARLLTTDSLVVDSEIEIIKSRQLLKDVATAAKIFEDPEYTEPGLIDVYVGPVLTYVKSFLGPSQSFPGRRENKLLDAFSENIDVERIGQTYVIQITYTSVDSNRAAEVANVIAQNYLVYSLQVQDSIARKSTGWLKDKLAELQTEVIAADRAVEAYRAENDLVSTVEGGLVSEQQVSELNQKLITAQSEATQAASRLRAAEQSLASGNYARLSSEQMSGNDLLTKLRTDYALIQARADEIGKRYGRRHQLYVKIRQQLAELDNQTEKELRRIIDGYEADYNAASIQEKSLTDSLTSLKRVSLQNSDKLVRLRELEQRATSARGLYQSLLDTFNRTSQQQSLPAVKARIIQTADSPPNWTKPNWKIILALSMFAGVGLGVGNAFLRSALNGSVTTAEDIEKVTRCINLGFVPNSKLLRLPAGRRFRRRRKKHSANDASADEPLPIAPASLAGYRDFVGQESGAATEALRAMHVAARLAKDSRQGSEAKIIAIGSTLPGEGKSTLAALFALHLAQSGERTLLMDFDFRRRTLTERLQTEDGSAPPTSIFDLATAENIQGIGKATLSDRQSGLQFLPAPSRREANRDIARLIAGKTDRLIGMLRPHYTYIVIDLPPLLQISDSRVIAEMIDHFILVAEWNKTDRRAIARSLESTPEIVNALIGTVFNKVNMRKLRSFNAYQYY